ncbi:TPA: hypothetical protein ROS33_000380 [Escherichia coli]|uniref:hypothetical protein n=1 Tax=Escherichia coli TaxID=562 RepID=UPI0002510A94|nr:hypothetical protein [Escherichia coli]EFN6800702.1 hypothetical protein [Escherichia coli O22:H8]ELO0451470.1 hypothetical protein [Escherichia coli O55]EEQ2121193.1 hypothetical protein [Escherichia coli]EES5059469.1 hypothetical protein [Escherichia coli]EET5422388.1 hypothetical protein [Escherichia coli]
MNQYELTAATQSADVRPESELNRAERISQALKAIKAELFNMSDEDLADLKQSVDSAIQKRNQVSEENKIQEAGLKVHQHHQANVPDWKNYF